MAITVNTNVPAITAQRYLGNATDGINKSMERLSSGYRINSAKDDAAGLQISNRLQSQSSGLDVAMRNAGDGLSITQTAEGAIKESTIILQRMRDLAIQSSNGSNSLQERSALNQEVSALKDELNRIAETTAFGSTKLLNGTFGTKSFQIGSNAGEAMRVSMANIRSDAKEMGGTLYRGDTLPQNFVVKKDENDTLEVSYTSPNGEDKTMQIKMKDGDDIEEVATYINGQTDVIQASATEDGQLQLFVKHGQTADDTVSLGGSLASAACLPSEGQTRTIQDLDVTSVKGSQEAISMVDAAIKSIDAQRADLGAIQNRLDHAISNLGSIQENVESSKGRIRDTDFAKTATELTKQNILQQSSSAILAQAKTTPSAALNLLG